MMKNDSMDVIRDNLNEMGVLFDWVGILLRDITSDYLEPLAYGKAGKEYDVESLVWCEGEAMAEKAEMILAFMSHITDHYDKISAAVFTSNPPRNHRDMTRAERIDEILNDVNEAVGIIEDRPDWLETMKELNGKAWALALRKDKRE